jgi:flagellar hook-associated protein 2
VRTTQQQIRSILGSSVSSGTFTVLSQIGITTQTDGTLALDSGKLNTVLASDSGGVRALLGGTGGFATKLDTLLDGVLNGDDGSLAAKSKGLQSRLDDIADQRSELNLRMAAVEKRYRAQFTALDTMMGQMQTTSSYLAQQLANLPKPY